MKKWKILVVDDAVVIRRVLTDALSADPELEVSTAANGRLALAKLDQVKPDLVTLDVEMPEMDGLETLKAIRKIRPKLPVIMFSTRTARGAGVTLDALAAGASDYLTKPANVGSLDETITRIRGELLPKIKALCGRAGAPALPAAMIPAPTRPATTGPVDVVAIGISTGGPNALSVTLPALPRELAVPVVIVQHMPPVFTKLLADRLSAQCAMPVVEATHGLPLRPGQAVLAAGGSHMVVCRRAGGIVVETNDGEPENSCRPAVDVLFRSVAAAYGARALAVVMTGMGSDGLNGCRAIDQAGGQVVVQDEATSVVWGMPGFVARAGLAQKQLPLDRIAAEIIQRVAQGRRLAA